MTHSINALVLHPADPVERVPLTAGDIEELQDVFGTGWVSYSLRDGVRLVLAEDHEDPSAGPRNHLAAAVLYAWGGRSREVYGSGLAYSTTNKGAVVVDLTPEARHMVRVSEMALSA